MSNSEKIRTLLHIPPSRNPTTPFLNPSTAAFLSQCTLLILGSLDSQNRPWSSLIAGPAGFTRGINTEFLAVSGRVALGDPILDNLSLPGERMLSGLGTDLAARRRAKIFGRVGDGMKRIGNDDGTLQVIWKIEQTLGNCPKYITTRRVTLMTPVTDASTRPERRTAIPGTPLPQSALALIQTADIFFITTRNGEKDMDTNLRGGPSGFVRVLPSSSASAPTSIIWPEYSGNRLYQTLGNLAVNPEAGLTFTDFVAGNVLYLTGTTEIMTLESGVEQVLPRSNLAVKFTIQEFIYLEAALPIRESPSSAETREFSPYNPPVRYLFSEKIQPPVANKKNSLGAKLVQITPLTPTTAIFRFSLSKQHTVLWEAGQYIAFEFADEIGLARGYKHMDDSDPQSLNDDYVRTFTIVSEPGDGNTVEILIRKVGVVTGWMFGLARNNRVAELGIEIPVRGFGGSFKVAQNGQGKLNFIAGGVGITPLLPSVKNINGDDLNVWWTVKVDDVGMVKKVLERYPSLGEGLKLFITGERHNVEGLDGIKVIWGRIEKKDLVSDGGLNEGKWYLCASTGLRTKVANWLEEEGQEVHWEDFGY